MFAAGTEPMVRAERDGATARTGAFARCCGSITVTRCPDEVTYVLRPGARVGGTRPGDVAATRSGAPAASGVRTGTVRSPIARLLPPSGVAREFPGPAANVGCGPCVGGQD